jgi:hypothetical protein
MYCYQNFIIFMSHKEVAEHTRLYRIPNEHDHNYLQLNLYFHFISYCHLMHSFLIIHLSFSLWARIFNALAHDSSPLVIIRYIDLLDIVACNRKLVLYSSLRYQKSRVLSCKFLTEDVIRLRKNFFFILVPEVTNSLGQFLPNFFPLWLFSPILGLGRFHETFRFFSVTRSRTVSRTPWTGDQLVAKPLHVCTGWLWGWRSWWNERFWQGKPKYS